MPSVQAMTGLGRTTIYRYLKAGLLPAPMYLERGQRARKFWRESDIVAWINERAVDSPAEAGQDSPEPQA